MLAKVRWLDEQGGNVRDDRPMVEGYLVKFTPWSANEYPPETGREAEGWTELAALYRAPAAARQAVIELHLQWAPEGRVDWSGIDLREAPPPVPRKVRLAAAHLQPRAGRTAEEKRRQYAPLIARAAAQKADLIVLGETLTYYGQPRGPAEVAEPVPGPSTAYFAELARKHDIHIVAGLYERVGRLVYNTAVLLSPEGKVAGKFHKVTMPDGEVERGVTPGREYPVFETRFGKLGIMICYDGFFPEVARELTKAGAEVIAWPVWGFNPELGRARAAENQVYVVSSTYEDVSSNWGYTAVWDRAGRPAAQAKDWGAVAVAEVDLGEPTIWRSLGHFARKIRRHVPIIPPSRRFQ